MSLSKEHHAESSVTKEDLLESSAKKIILKSFDGETFEIEVAVALESKTIKHLIDDVSDDTGIPIPNVTGKILAKVIEYCKKHVESARSNEKPLQDELKKWDAEFVQVDQNTFFDLMLAANFLDIKSLLDLTCRTAADMMLAAKTPEAIREKFNIKNDYSPEEEQKIRSENQWAFE